MIGDIFLRLAGITGTIKRIAPTEQVYLELRDFFQDFNYEMSDGSWAHLEFESDSITEKDLVRFRAYEAVISHHYGVAVTTYVVCSSSVKKLKSQLTQGINTYRVKLVRLRDQNADTILKQLESQAAERELERQDMLNLILTPLMEGKTSQLERILKSFRLLRNSCGAQDSENLRQLQAVLYLLAMKFLTPEELKIVKEELRMTYLGELIRQDGFNDGFSDGFDTGFSKGELHKLIQLICRKLQKNKTPESIAEELEEDESFVRKICDMAKDCGPEYDSHAIYERLNSEQTAEEG